MARAVNRLAALGVSRAKDPGRYGDGAVLYPVSDPGGSRRWIMIFRPAGRQREMGLGSAAVVSLTDARKRRDETHRITAEGRDPIAEKKRTDPATVKAVTFGAFAEAPVLGAITVRPDTDRPPVELDPCGGEQIRRRTDRTDRRRSAARAPARWGRAQRPHGRTGLPGRSRHRR